MQQPTGQPNWPTPQPGQHWPMPQPVPPPRRRGGWKRGLTITALGILGLIAGGMTGSAFVVVDYALGTILMMVGMWVGLALGILFGVKMTARPRQPIDPDRYPNRIFRRV